MMKKMMMTLVMSIFGIIGFGFAMPNCLENFSDTEIQKMETIKTVLETNTTKFEQRFPGATLEIQKLVQEINATQLCNEGFTDFEDFTTGIKQFVQALIAKKSVATENTDPEYDAAVNLLQKNLLEFFSLGMERNTFDYYNFDQDVALTISSKHKYGDNYNNFNMEANFVAKGKGSQKDLKIDTNIKGEITGSVDSENNWGNGVTTQKGDGSIDFDANILMNNKDLYLTLNDLNTELNIDKPFVNAIADEQVKKIKEKLINKTIHLPLPEDFSTQYSKLLLLLQKPEQFDFLRVVDYGNKKTIALGTQFCEFTSTLDDQRGKGTCLNNLKEINDKLREVSHIEKVGNDIYKITVKDDEDSFSITWNKNEITTINGNFDETSVHYNNKNLDITVPEKVTISGKRDSKNGIDLDIKDLNQNDAFNIKGNITTSAHEMTANMKMNGQDENIAHQSNFSITIKNMFNEISAFSIQTPKNVIEAEELESLFDM